MQTSRRHKDNSAEKLQTANADGKRARRLTSHQKRQRPTNGENEKLQTTFIRNAEIWILQVLLSWLNDFFCWKNTSSTTQTQSMLRTASQQYVGHLSALATYSFRCHFGFLAASIGPFTFTRMNRATHSSHTQHYKQHNGENDVL